MHSGARRNLISLPSSALSFPSPRCACRVSSVLNGSREYGKQNLFDGRPESCWNSDQGTPQFIQIAFERPVDLESVGITFQGGFVGRSCALSVTNAASPKRLVQLHIWEPRDTNDPQHFVITPPADAPAAACQVTNLKLTFPASTDFFGRITIYALEITGKPSAASGAAEAAGADSAAAAATAPSS